ncbi:MAG: phasin family protein [Thermoanaerobaculia bacterium]|nr:phasin family protein [Thermoanaerobaculia bacterium]
MTTKKKREKNVIPAELRESAQKIWLAGLGAVAMAEEEGEKLFSSLVERGESFERRSKKRMKEVQEKVEDRVEEARDKAESSWSKLEDTVDEKIAAALKRLGVPTRSEIQKLTKRVEELTLKIDGLKSSGSKRPAAKSKRTTTKTA